MIFLRLAGGLGNQLFQIAASYVSSEALSLPVFICEESLNRYKVVRTPLYRSLLDLPSLFFIDNSYANPLLVSACLNLRVGKMPFFGLRQIPPRGLCAFRRKFPIFMDGYYCDCWDINYFTKAVASIRSMLKPREPGPSCVGLDVAIHVRGGDFIGLSEFDFVGYSYYRSCVGLAISQGFLNFVVVSDDPIFSAKITKTLAADYPSASFTLWAASSPLDDFHVLRTAYARIIGNSTFAWWAFALSPSLGPTWSPGAFLKNRPRPYRLPEEIVVDVS